MWGLLVRAKHDRVLGEARPKLFETLGSGAADGHIAVEDCGTDGTSQVQQEEGAPDAPEASGAV